MPRAVMRLLEREKSGSLPLSYSEFSSQTKEDKCEPALLWLGPEQRRYGGEPRNAFTCISPSELQTRHTHSLLRLSSPVKAPLVSSIVPEISLWSRSLGRRESSPSSLSSQLFFQHKLREQTDTQSVPSRCILAAQLCCTIKGSAR